MWWISTLGTRNLSTKSDIVEPTCKKFSTWKNCGKPVLYIRHDNALENKVLIKSANDSQWKLGITAEYTRKCTPQWNQLTELGFADITGMARAMMVQANISEEMKYKLCEECFNVQHALVTYHSDIKW